MKPLLVFVLLYSETLCEFPPRIINKDHELQANRVTTLIGDIIQDTTWRIAVLDTMQKENSDNVQFEVGYLTQIIQDRYRRMIDMYTTCKSMRTKFYIMEHIIYLHDIEHIYWEINHITNMLHEIERKYNHVEVTYQYDWQRTIDYNATTIQEEVEQVVLITKGKKKSRFVMDRYIKDRLWSTKKLKKKYPWDLDYGWDEGIEPWW